MNAIKEAIEALEGLDEAYCRAGAPLTRDERTEDRKRLIKARAALAALRSMPEAVPTAWGMPAKDGGIYDVITPAEHDKFEGGYTVPLYLHTTPPPATVQLSDAWISVEERMPEIGQEVLLWVYAERHDEDDDGNPRTTDVSGVHMGEYRSTIHGEYLDNYSSPFADQEGITHWQPLPPPPIEQAIGRASREAK